MSLVAFEHARALFLAVAIGGGVLGHEHRPFYRPTF